MGDILCATYAVYFRDRRTQAPVIGCDLDTKNVEGKWRRVLRDTSTADITWQINDECCECRPRPHMDEMVIERRGDTDSQVWVGPVIATDLDLSGGTMTVEAADRSYWWSRRQAFQNAITAAGVDVAEAWALIRKDQDSIDGSGLHIVSSPLGRTVDLAVAKWDDVSRALSEVEEGISWTVAGSTLHGPGPTTVGEASGGTIDTATDWGAQVGTQPSGTGVGPTVVEDGENQATQVVVIGDGVTGIYPETLTSVPAAGYHLARVDRSDLSTQRQVDTLAERLYRRNRDTGLYIATQRTTLRKGSHLAIADLICGRRYDAAVSGHCVDFVQQVELAQVVVDFGFGVDQDAGAIREKSVAIDLAPIGIDPPFSLLTV